jgi:hypothetical protein
MRSHAGVVAAAIEAEEAIMVERLVRVVWPVEDTALQDAAMDTVRYPAAR